MFYSFSSLFFKGFKIFNYICEITYIVSMYLTMFKIKMIVLGAFQSGKEFISELLLVFFREALLNVQDETNVCTVPNQL